MGYADYNGPWGWSLNTGQNQTLSFIKSYVGSYTLRVETVTEDYSDFWSASVSCNNTGYSGSDLFKAIYFFDGDAASRLPYFNSIRNEISKFNSTQQAQRQSFNNEITSIVNSLNPGFFNKLHQKIYSSDLDTINAIIDEGAKLLEVAVINSSYNQYYQTAQSVAATIDTSLYNFETESGLNAYLVDYGNRVANSSSVRVPDQFGVFFAAVVAVAIWDAVAVVNYGVIVNAAAVAVVYAAVYVKTAFWPKKKPAPKPNKLQTEKFVGDVLKFISERGSGS